MSIKMILFEDAGMPVDLADPSRWLKAIKRGQLRRLTAVKVLRVGDAAASAPMPAQDVPELKLLFDALDPQRPEAPVPAPDMAAEPETELSLDKSASGDEAAPLERVPAPVDDEPPHVVPDEPAEAPTPPAIMPPPGQSKPSWKPVAWAGGVILMIGVVMVAANSRRGRATNNSAYATTASTTTASDVNMATTTSASNTASAMENSAYLANTTTTTTNTMSDVTTNSMAAAEPPRISTARQGNGVRNSSGPGDRYLIVMNLCSRPISLLVNWRTATGYQRTPSNGWDIPDNSSRILGVNGADIFPDSPSVYYTVRHYAEPSRGSDGSNVYFSDGSSTPGRQATMSLGAEQHYTLTFCPNYRRSLAEG